MTNHSNDIEIEPGSPSPFPGLTPGLTKRIDWAFHSCPDHGPECEQTEIVLDTATSGSTLKGKFVFACGKELPQTW